MYAMLTGTLPFTVEPFSLRALYQKMVDKEMNPLPTQLSTGRCLPSWWVRLTEAGEDDPWFAVSGVAGSPVSEQPLRASVLRPSLFH